MIKSPSTTRRLLIPRWRTFADTKFAGELATQKTAILQKESSAEKREFMRRKERWHANPSEITAAEFVEAAIIFGQPESASSAAQFLTGVQADVTTLVRRQAQQLLASLHSSPSFEANNLNSIRENLRTNPGDAVLWVELARQQTISGANDSAARSMRVALKLAPDNRFVLRSAARFFSHIHEPDIGYDLLRRSAATEYDPWLMAAEIAMAGRADRKPIFLKKGISLVGEDKAVRREFSELAGAAATTFLGGSISRRKAKKLFVQSLHSPTSNSVAQAEWASQNSGERFFKVEEVSSFSAAKEAQALHFFNVGDYSSSLQAAREWILEEEFSGRAYSAAASAANMLDDYAAAIEICEEGVRRDPKSHNLKHSLVFALASSGKLYDAEQALANMRPALLDDVDKLVADANEGLIAFRRGDISKGEASYNKAVSGFRRYGSPYLSISALAYFAREALRAGHPKAREISQELERLLRRHRHVVGEKIMSELNSSTGGAEMR